jgi:hypothetical protein
MAMAYSIDASSTTCFWDTVGQTISETAKTTVRTINQTVEWIDHTITYYCDNNLPHPINVIAKAAIKALPFIIMQACLPTPVHIACIIAIVAYSALTRNPEQPSSSLKDTFINAFTFRSFVSAGTNAIAFAQTGAIPSLLWTITNLTLGVLTFLQSNLAKDVFQKHPAAAV